MKKIFILVFLLTLTSCSLFGGASEKQKIATPEQKTELKTIIALWDSLTAWYGVTSAENFPTKLEARLQAEWYNYRVVNGGISGDTSAGLKSRSELYLEQKPEIVIIGIGANDWLRGLSVVELEANILEIVDVFLAKDIEVVLSGMDIPPTLWFSYRSQFKAVYESIAQQRPKIKLLWFFLEDVALRPKLNLRDNIHPNSDGYDIIVENMYSFIEKQKILIK